MCQSSPCNEMKIPNKLTAAVMEPTPTFAKLSKVSYIFLARANMVMVSSLCCLFHSPSFLLAFMFIKIRIGLVARIPRFHRGGRGSIPRCGTCFLLLAHYTCTGIACFLDNLN